MIIDEIKEYCMSKPKSYEDKPFGPIPICYKLNGKIFAQLYPIEYGFKITLKCPADYADFYRMLYPGVVVRGYHCPPSQQPYWNTVYLDSFSKEELWKMIDLSYATVLKSFSKKVQKELLKENN